MRIKISLDYKGNDAATWLGSIIISFQYICAMIAIPGISIILAFLIIGISLYQLAKHRFVITKQYLMMVIYVMIVFLISFLFLTETAYTLNYFERFVLYDMVALLIGFQIKDTDGIIKKVIIIGIIGIPFLLISNVDVMNSSDQMGYAYSCLPILIASFLGFGYDRIFKIICSINIIIILIKCSTFAPRGVLVIIFTVIITMLYWHVSTRNSKNLKLIVSISILLILFSGVLYIFSNLENIIECVNDFLIDKFNVRVYAFDKYLRYIAQDKLYNGRDYIWALAINAIRENPVIGYGIGWFENSALGSYCHNIILQSFCEAGIFFGIPVIFYTGRQVLEILKSPFSEDKVSFKWLMLIFCIGTEILFFSSVYWSYMLFWYFLGSYLHKQNRSSLKSNGEPPKHQISNEEKLK